MLPAIEAKLITDKVVMKNAETSNGHAAPSLSSLCEELFMVSCNVELLEFSSVDQKYRSSSTSEFSFGDVRYTVGARVKRPKTARRQDGLTLSLNVSLSMVLRVIYKRAVQLLRFSYVSRTEVLITEICKK